MRQKVRLGDSDVNHIIESFKQHFGKDDHLWLFGSRVDLERRGVFGHSFGGAISLALCQGDNRIKAGVDLDGKLPPWNEKQALFLPFLFVVAEHSEAELQPIKQLVSVTTPRPEYVELATANHGSFTDLYLIVPWNALPKLDPIEGIQITRKLLVDFFGKHLKN